MPSTPKVLLVDLNNFARYPTLSIGYLVSILRAASIDVSVFAPLMVGVRGTTREATPHRFSLIASKLNHYAATARSSWVRHLRDHLAARRLSDITVHDEKVIEGFRVQLQAAKPQAVMISTYLMYRDVCARICILCREAGIPVLIGGPYFVQPEVIAAWVGMPGLTALVAGEVEQDVPSILRTVLAAGDAHKHIGVFAAGADGEPKGQVAPPLRELDAVPFPDYSDFPWQAYPNRIVPIVTGRGCGWGVCSFCSDVTSSAGRTYRSRSPENVISELSSLHQRYGVTRFVFTDLKLNSNVAVWRAIHANMQAVVPDGRWIGAVHVGAEKDNGLSLADLREAARGGCVRLTTGLESGSQRMADLMKKGTRLDAIAAFLQGATSAGISCRCTMILGYPGETAEDVLTSAEFLATHSREIERVTLNRLQVIYGTALQRSLINSPQKFKGVSVLNADPASAHVEHRSDVAGTPAHRRAVMRLLDQVHLINSRALSQRAREFEGVM